MQLQSTPTPHEAAAKLGQDRAAKKRGHRKGEGSAKTHPERSCVVTRQVKAPQEMIRFVLSPDGKVVPDLKASLPGRGVWVTATAEMVAKAVKSRAFDRGFKAKVTVVPDLVDVIDGILVARVLQHLGLARKAGRLVTGFAKVDAALRADELAVLITAKDAAADGQEKLKRLARAIAGSKLCFVEVANSQQLSMALGLEHVIHAGVMKDYMASAVETAARRLLVYRGMIEMIR